MKKNKNEERYENFFEVLIRNWKTVPGLKELVKLFLGFMFLFILVIVMVGTNNETRKSNKTTTTTITTTTTTANSYANIIDYFIKSKFSAEGTILIDNVEYSLNYTYQDNVLTGYLENINNTYHFKIKDNQIYEIKLNNEELNENIFNGIDINYIIPNKLKEVLITNDFVKSDNSYIYNLENKRMNVITNGKTINKIDIEENNNKYKIEFK